jgi:glutamate racemase
MSLQSVRFRDAAAVLDVAPAPHVLVFDSGLGGLSVLKELRVQLPAACVTYVADDAAFPYGDWQETALHDHIVALMGHLIDTYRPDLVVIACNTASTLVLPTLRARHEVPFVGTVPAIKPAAAATRSGLLSVIATPRAIASDYTRQLVELHAIGVEVTLVGASRLAAYAEAWLGGEPVDEAAVAAEIAPCFVEREGRRTDVVVLGCTHYPLLLPIFERVQPWPVDWVDGARAIARRAAGLVTGVAVGGCQGRIVFTAGKPLSPQLVARLDAFGLSPDEAV